MVDFVKMVIVFLSGLVFGALPGLLGDVMYLVGGERAAFLISFLFLLVLIFVPDILWKSGRVALSARTESKVLFSVSTVVALLVLVFDVLVCAFQVSHLRQWIAIILLAIWIFLACFLIGLIFKRETFTECFDKPLTHRFYKWVFLIVPFGLVLLLIIMSFVPVVTSLAQRALS